MTVPLSKNNSDISQYILVKRFPAIDPPKSPDKLGDFKKVIALLFKAGLFHFPPENQFSIGRVL
jgi:hypothetical protein